LNLLFVINLKRLRLSDYNSSLDCTDIPGAVPKSKDFKTASFLVLVFLILFIKGVRIHFNRYISYQQLKIGIFVFLSVWIHVFLIRPPTPLRLLRETNVLDDISGTHPNPV
jgi:uncharacterized membrane protein YozB (DUF420 family)